VGEERMDEKERKDWRLTAATAARCVWRCVWWKKRKWSERK